MQTELRVEFSTEAVMAKLEAAKSALEQLPESVVNMLRDRFSHRIDLGVDLVPADDSATVSASGGSELIGRYVAVCPVLDELIAAAIGAANVG
jgi:hypothetical protein